MATPTPFSNARPLPSETEIARRHKLGAGMLERGMDASPVGHWTQGLARVLQGGVGGWHTSQARGQEEERSSGLMNALRGSPAFKGLSESDLTLLGADPDLMRATASKIYGNKLDPQAGLRNQLMQLQIQGQGQDQAHQREMRPLDIEMKRAQIAAAGQRDVKEVNGRLVRVGPNGAEVVYDGGPNFDKLPEYAAKSAGFASRMIDAEQSVRPIVAGEARPDPRTGLKPLSRLDLQTGRAEDSFDPTSNWTYALEKVGEKAANMTVRGKEYQKYRQGAEQWIRAFLRKESGAAIAKDEFDRDFFVYFPQPGDDPETVQQKERARQVVKRSFVGETRGFFDHVNPEAAQQLKEWERRQTSGPTSPTTVVPNPVAAAPPPAQQQPRPPVGPEFQTAKPLARPASKADFDALPPGTRFLDPNGYERVKP